MHDTDRRSPMYNLTRVRELMNLASLMGRHHHNLAHVLDRLDMAIALAFK